MAQPSPRHLIPIGGFLGAGKTTAVRRLANYLNDQGLRVGIITNDQGVDLVDTRMARACSFTTEEIDGGCFCCRFDDLVGATRRLTLEADVLIAEAVGSCTDLRATVVGPLRRLESDHLTVGPLSVVVDPLRACTELGLGGSPCFSPDVRYVYDRQLEEADLLVINKCDLMDARALDALQRALAARYPHATVLSVSARNDEDLSTWFGRLLESPDVRRPAMDVDYDVYASGEARLAWLDAVITVAATPACDADQLLTAFAGAVRRGLLEVRAEVAHAKMTLESGDPDAAGMGAISLARGAALPDVTFAFPGRVRRGSLTVNLRAETTPDTLTQVLGAAMVHAMNAGGGLALTLERCAAFSPGRPAPTHRDNAG